MSDIFSSVKSAESSHDITHKNCNNKSMISLNLHYFCSFENYNSDMIFEIYLSLEFFQFSQNLHVSEVIFLTVVDCMSLYSKNMRRTVSQKNIQFQIMIFLLMIIIIKKNINKHISEKNIHLLIFI